jgi:hypothetical protein
MMRGLSHFLGILSILTVAACSGGGEKQSTSAGGSAAGGARSGGSSGGGLGGAGGNSTTVTPPGTGGAAGMTGSGGSSPPSSGGRSTTGGSVAGGSGSGGAPATGGNTSGSGGATGGSPMPDAGAAGGTTPATGGSGTGAPDGGPRDARGTGGVAGAGGTASTGGTTGAGGGTGAGGSTSAGQVFSQCRFHFGTGDWITTATVRSEIDYFISGWMLGTTFDHKSVCTESASGGALAGKLPVQIAYVAANYAKGHHALCDCNVSGCSGGNLCNYGAQYITQDWAAILAAYTAYSDGFAGCMGGRPIVFEMEPDWYQYYAGGQTQAWTPAQAGTNMTALVNALKSNSALKAYFSMDISPWIPNNGSAWYPNFNMGLFTFINTSGGGTDAGNTKIRSSNAMTWAGVSQVTGKPILADTGYGAAGAPAGEDAAWNVAANINSRMADGVVGICQYSPGSSWGTTVAGIRGSLNQPKICP